MIILGSFSLFLCNNLYCGYSLEMPRLCCYGEEKKILGLSSNIPPTYLRVWSTRTQSN